MVYIFKDRIIRIEWTVLKGISNAREDFSRALLKLFLIGRRERYLVEVESFDNGTVKATIPQGLEEGSYSVELIYVKNWDSLRRGDMEPHRHPVDCKFNDRCLMRTRKDDLFSITEFESEATNIGEGVVVLKVKTSTATYGYDGLSSYELAVLRGDWNGTEGEWLKHERYVSVLDSRGDSEVDTMSQKAITDELEAQDNAIEDIRKDTEKLGDRVEEAEEKVNNMGDVVDEIKSHAPVSARPAGFKPDIDLTPEITVDRAWRDHEGNVIRDTYITRRGLRNEIIDITNQQVRDLKPGSVDPDDLSEATKQLIGNKSITNLPDEEDITVTDNRTLKLKDKEYAPKDYSGMGRVYLRKHYVNGVNTLTQHMMRKPNTIYIIQYDYCLAGQTIEVPENCVLDFQGGSLRNGHLILKNNYVRNAYESFKSTLNMIGSVKNSEISTEWFEMPEEDCFSQFKNIVGLSNNSFVPIVFKKGEYIFKNDGNSFTITQSINFKESKITLDTNGFEHFSLKVSNSKYENVDLGDLSEFSIAISNHDKLNPVFRKYKNSLLDVKSDEVEIMRRHNLAVSPILKEEILYIDMNGFMYNEPYNDSFTAKSARSMDCSVFSYFKNAIFKIRDNFTGNQSEGYRNIGFEFTENANLNVENILLEDPNIENYRLSIFRVNNGYNIQILNCNITNTRNNQALINNDKSAYSITGSKIIKWHMSNLCIGNLEGSAWGATGCNYITDWVIDNSSLSRIDVHHRLNNLYVNNSIIGKHGLSYTGFGKIIISNSEFRGQTLLKARDDYGSYFDGNIIIKDCSWKTFSTNALFVMYVGIHNFDFRQASKRTNFIGAKELDIDGLRIIGEHNKKIILVRSYYNDEGKDYAIIPQRIYPKQSFSNISSDEPCMLLVDISYYQDVMYKKDSISIDFFNCDFSDTYVMQGLSEFYLQGHTYEEYMSKKHLLGEITYNLYNCKMSPMAVWSANSKMNINGGTVGLTVGEYTLQGKKYLTDTEFYVSNVTIKPNLIDYPNMVSPNNSKPVCFNSCIFSVLEGSDVDLIENYYKFAGNIIFANRNKSILCNGCIVDKKLANILDVNEGTKVISIHDRNIDNYIYLYPDNEDLEINIGDYLRNSIYKFRLNCSSNPLRLILPDGVKYNGCCVEIIVQSADNNITFSMEVEGQELTRIPYIISKIFEGQVLSLFFHNNGVTGIAALNTLTGNSDYRVSIENFVLAGTSYFDKTLSKPVWWTGTNWVDATGATV